LRSGQRNLIVVVDQVNGRLGKAASRSPNVIKRKLALDRADQPARCARPTSSRSSFGWSLQLSFEAALDLIKDWLEWGETCYSSPRSSR
jgi:hypothetical protein